MSQRRHLASARSQALKAALAAGALLLGAGCATLPDASFLSERYAVQASHFRNALGPLSARRSAAIMAQLKRTNGDLDILDRQTVLEQQIGGSALVVGNKVTLLQDGPATYAAMFSAMRAATTSIHIESYIIEEGEIGRQFADVMVEKQASGVQVNVIYDSVGSYATGKPYFERLRQAGVQVVEFNPVNPLASGKAWSPNHRDHRKLLVTDGATAFVGGVNISSVYLSGSSPRARPVEGVQGWRDTHVRIDGPAATEFEALFGRTWEKQKGPPLAQRLAPPPPPRGEEMVRAIGSSPDDPFSQIYLTLVSAITNAEHQVFITNAYFVPDPQLLAALLEAARRGVEVRLILPGSSDSAMAFQAGRSYYAQLLEGGVKIHERKGAPLHAKTAVVDGVWSVIGSSNLDWRSALDNDEINAVILGREFGRQMQAVFAADLAASDPIEPAAWARRPLAMRLKELSARLFGPLL